MGRLAWYAGVSTALAAGVVVSAFNQRANFYSACVYLAQSNLCLMILINLILFIYGSFMYGLQRLCYGALRPIEVEQLYEKAWFAVTETCLAMTIFREEVGAWFLVMFVALLTGKVWGWIGDGRVEILEQQPPTNPRLFHIRLSISLLASVLYDLWLMSYTINTVIQQARPNMMVMFLFEFAILTTSSFSTAFRYNISLVEASVVKKQTHDRLVERRREVREERAEMIRQREAAAAGGEGSDAPSTERLPSEDDVDEMDIEVPGWDAKGQWILTLDLITDFVKLCIYLSFFFILLMFYGMPIHIMRDLFMTTRSFVKRLTAFLRYRRATHDMNKRYADATVEDIQREDTCIICREEMKPWAANDPEAQPAVPGAAPPPTRPTTTTNERSRAKKLPCGHILHLGCLKSWLERQQVCPTCRNPVVDSAQTPRAATNNANPPPGPGPQPALPGQQDGAGAGAAPPAPGRGGRGMRMLNFGPLRVGFGQANLQDLAQGFGRAQPQENAVAGGARVYGLELGFPRRLQPQPQGQGATSAAGSNTLQDHLQQIEQQIVSEIRSLQVTQQELQLVQLLQVELARLRLMQNGATDPLAANFQMPQVGPSTTRQTAPFSTPLPHMQRHGARSNTSAIPAGSPDLPPGVTIPEGWTLLPLQRLDGPPVTQATTVPAASNAGLAPTATTTQPATSPMPGTSNNISAPAPSIIPENHSQASSVDSSDTNAIHTPPSIITDQPNTANPLLANPTAPGTSSSTTPGLSSSNPSVLPDWGSSQLFSGPTLTSNTSIHAPPPDSGVESSSMDTGHSSSVSTHIETPSQDSEDRRRDKGKAKAATVEDTVDEAEGA